MSFILDALKKSENERQRNIGPSLAEIQVRRPQSERPWWAVAVAALLVINLGVLLIVLMREPAPPTPAATVAEQHPASAAPAPQPATVQPTMQPNTVPPAAVRAPSNGSPAVQPLEEAASPVPYEDEPPYNPALAGAARVPDRPPVVQPINPATGSAIPSETTFPARTRGPAEDVILPTLESLVASGVSVPEMRLDIHVYHSNPRERFVLINMRKYVEGQVLSEGPMLERISQEGVILNHNGQRFLLPRN
ncbi:MAG TPA: general secretion pathway protein GspB [Steroidobacteraceae bacterium]